MRAAIVTAVFLVGFIAIIHHGSACNLKLNRVQREGCIALRYALRSASNPPVCGQNSASCQTNGEGIVDKSVKVQYFEVRGQCRIYGPYQWHRSHDPLFYGMVTGGHIMLTGRQRFNGLERDFKATIQANPRGYIKAEIDASQCVKRLSSDLKSRPYGENFQEILSQSSGQILRDQLVNGALDEMVGNIISQAPSMLG